MEKIKALFNSFKDLFDNFRKEKEIGLEQELTDEEEEKQTKNILKVTAKLIKHETDFDRFEILSALSFANHGFISGNQDAWGPIGRFGWKYKNSFMSGNPFEDLIEEANNNGNDWLPIKSGFFNKSYPRFLELCKAFKVRLEKLSWF